MKNSLKPLLFLFLIISLGNCKEKKEKTIPTPQDFRIAFGSCGHQTHPLPIFDEVVKHNPDLFIFLGDNIYGDTHSMDTLKAKYDQLAAKPSFKNLKANTELMATWDDHDFGWNDAGRHYPYKEESKKLLLDFFDEPANSERRNREGIYDAKLIAHEGINIQVILLDTRTFRDDLLKHDGAEQERKYFYPLDYAPHQNEDSTLLGKAQWQWLDEQLQVEADVRIIASSTQFGIEFNGYEAWANFPHERQRFLALIKKNKANGVIFISGDVHYGEISKFKAPDNYPIYDVTSSGLSSTWLFATPNDYRIEGPIMDNHFGLISISPVEKNLNVKMEIWDIRGNQRVEHTINTSEISF